MVIAVQLCWADDYLKNGLTESVRYSSDSEAAADDHQELDLIIRKLHTLLLLFRVMEIQRICEVTATPCICVEGANLSE